MKVKTKLMLYKLGMFFAIILLIVILVLAYFDFNKRVLSSLDGVGMTIIAVLIFFLLFFEYYKLNTKIKENAMKKYSAKEEYELFISSTLCNDEIICLEFCRATYISA